jgi:hypothetical protein
MDTCCPVALTKVDDQGRDMFSWQWESFEEIIKSYAPVVNDHGPLAGPIHRFTIRRERDLSLRMETEAPDSANEPQSPYPAGTVRINDDRVTFHSDLGLELEAIGVQATRTNRHLEGIATGVTTQRAGIHRLVGKLQGSETPRYAIDWLDNVPSHYLWCDTIESKNSDSNNVVLGGVPSNRPKFEMKSGSSGGGVSWAAAGLEVGGLQLYLCNLEKIKDTHAKKPGCIVYVGLPDDKFRDRVRRCLSYVLGSYFVYLGVSRFDAEWHTTNFEAISPYSMRGQAVMLPPTPPSPLGGPRGFWDIDARRLSIMVNALYSKYEELSFGVVSWAYWHAVTATPHIAAVHFGAALESLQRAFLASAPVQSSSTVVDDETWGKIRSALDASLISLELPSKTLETFKDKVRNLNSRSQHSTSKDLMDELGLVLSTREKQAHNARHESAHGKDDEVDIEWIRDLELLRVLFHRILLAMTQANDEYFDYFTPGTPIRKVKEPVPG